MNHISISSSAQNTKKTIRRPLSKRIEMSLGAIIFVCVALLCVLSLLFLSHSNKVATKGYELKILQAERSQLIRKNDVLSMQISDLQSLNAMESDNAIRSMVRAERPKYIRTDTAVAINNNTSPDS